MYKMGEVCQIAGVTRKELQEAYYGSTVLNTKMTGEFPVLGAGNTAISWPGVNVTRVSVTPRWVAL